MKLAKWILYFNFGLSVLWILILIVLGIMAYNGSVFAKEFFDFDVSQYHTEALRKVYFCTTYILIFAEPIIWILIFYDYKKEKGYFNKNDSGYDFPIFIILISYVIDIKSNLHSHDILTISIDIISMLMLAYVAFFFREGYLE